MQNFPPPNNQYGGTPPSGAMPPGSQKKSKTPWIIGGVIGCLVLGIVGIVILFLLGVFAAIGLSGNSNSGRGGDVNRPAPVQTANTKRYVNSRAGLSPKLAENYADFSFNYPDTWKQEPRTASDSNFVKVEKSANSNTQENFAVGYFTGTGTANGDRLLMPNLVNQLSSQFAASFPNYQKVSEGETRVGAYNGYEFKFTAAAKTAQGNVNIYGRAVLISGASGSRNGVALIMLATSSASGINGVNDVGVKGETPVILNSFRLGT